MADLTYPDDIHTVDLFDHVEIDSPEISRSTVEGQITKIFTRAGEVRVRYEDHDDSTRSGDPRIKSARVRISALSLIRRDG